MMLSRSRVAAWGAVVIGAAAVSACAAVIDVGSPSLDTDEGGTLPMSSADASAGPDTSTRPDSSALIDSGPPDAGQVTCATAKCPLATQSCCAYHSGGTPEYKLECAAACHPPDQTADWVGTLRCSNASDCPSQKCCIALKTLTTATSACKAACGANEALVCDRAANGCGSGSYCESLSMVLPPPYGYCRRSGVGG